MPHTIRRIFISVHVLAAVVACLLLPPWCPIAFVLLHIPVALYGWKLLPSWAKTISKSPKGTTHFNIIGQMDCSHQSWWNRIIELACLLSDVTKQEVTGNQLPLPMFWLRMLVSYLVVLLHRNLVYQRISDHAKDSIILSVANDRNVDPVSREALESLMERIRFAKWAYPFDKNYANLEECLKQEGFTLLIHEQTPAPGRVAHYVAIHKESKVLLLVPRGSSALSDIVTDAAGNPTEQKIELVGMNDERIQSIWSHEGSLVAANALSDQTISLVERLVRQEGFKLEVVGHSLGASVACVLGVLFLAKIPELRDPNRFHIWAYAPPPCLNESASSFLEPYVSTIVWNNDVIPTLSVSNYVFTCKVVAHMHEQEAKFHGWLSVPRALLAAATTTLGFETPITLSEKRLDHMCEYAIRHAKSVHRDLQMQKDPSHVHVPGKVIYLWERSHGDVATGEINGVSAVGSKFLHLHVVLPSKQSFNDHFLESYESGMQRLLNQMGDRPEHRRSIFLWENIQASKLDKNV